MERGTKIIVQYVESAYNTNKKTKKIKQGRFIKEYNNYILFYDKYNIRRTVMKQDLIDLERIEE